MSGNHKLVSIGQDCRISEDAHLENVICGDRVIIDDGVQLKNVVIGDGTKISRKVTMYSSEAERPIRIGKEVWISYGVFAEGTGGEIVIGDYSVIAHFTTLLTSSGPGAKSPLLNELFTSELGDIIIADHCWIGAHNLLLPHVVMQEGTVIASNSVVRKLDFAPWSMYAGNPAQWKKTFDATQIESIKKKHAL